MSEKLPLYNEVGQVVDPGKAREAADIETKYHKKTWGIFGPSRGKIKKGEKESELAIEEIEEISVDTLPDVVSKEIDKTILAILKPEKKVLTFNKAYRGDIGGGVYRYHIIGKTEGNTTSMTIAPTNATPVSVPVTFSGEEIELVVDVKENIVIQSKLNREK